MRATLVLLLACWTGLAFADENKSTPPKPDPAVIKQLIEQLGDRSFQVREAATRKLRKLGVAARKQLQTALKSEDLEVRMRAKALLEDIPETHAAQGMFAVRSAALRQKLLQQYGGDAQGEAAVGRALDWLARHQQPNGKWDGDGFGAQCKQQPACGGRAKLGWVDTGLTGLSLMAFLGAGHTHRQGKHKKTVKMAIRYLMKIQGADGLVGGKAGHYMYNHAICTQALVEAYALTRSPLVKGAARKAVEYLLDAQNPGMAWRYRSRSGDNDSSVTIWCVMALRAASAAGLPLRKAKRSFAWSRAFYAQVTDGTHSITGYRKRPPRGWQGPTSSRFIAANLGVNTANSHAANHSPTAIATTARAFLGVSRKDPSMSSSGNVLLGMLPSWDTGGGGRLSRVDCYYWYYGTLAMFQMGGLYWKRWNPAMRKALLERQILKGETAGSWDPIGAWGFAGGRVYATAINALSLEIYYRYPRLK